MLFTGSRVARDQQDSRTAQRDGVFKTRLAKALGGELAGQCDRSDRVHIGLESQMVGPRDQLHFITPMDLPSAVISTVACAGRGDSSVTSIGKRSPLNTWPVKPTDSSNSPGFGRPISGTVSMGMPVVGPARWRAPRCRRFDCRRRAAAGGETAPAGSPAAPSSDGGFEIRGVGADSGRMAQFPVPFGALFEGSDAGRAGKWNQTRPVAAARLARACRHRRTRPVIGVRNTGGGVR